MVLTKLEEIRNTEEFQEWVQSDYMATLINYIRDSRDVSLLKAMHLPAERQTAMCNQALGMDIVATSLEGLYGK